LSVTGTTSADRSSLIVLSLTPTAITQAYALRVKSLIAIALVNNVGEVSTTLKTAYEDIKAFGMTRIPSAVISLLS